MEAGEGFVRIRIDPSRDSRGVLRHGDRCVDQGLRAVEAYRMQLNTSFFPLVGYQGKNTCRHLPLGLCVYQSLNR